MATNTIKMRIQFRRDTAANWLLYKDVIPAAGEPCFEIDTGVFKIGDGVTTYENLKNIGGACLSADGKSIVIEDGVLKLAGFDAAETGAQPRKNAEGKLEWVVPSTETVEGLQATVAGLQSDVNAVQEILTPTGEGQSPLADRVSSLETKMDGTGEGTVDAKIDAKINDFANKISEDGTVNTFKELVDYVAAHGSETADMAADITALQGLVGDTSVASQITEAVSGKVDAVPGKGLSTNDFTNTLLNKLDGIESSAQANKIETVKLGENALTVTDKSVVVPIGAGLAASDEVTISESGALGIGSVSVAKLVNDAETTLILDGGNAV